MQSAPKQAGVVSQRLSSMRSPPAVKAYDSLQAAEGKFAEASSHRQILAEACRKAKAEETMKFGIVRGFNSAAMGLCKQHGIAEVGPFAIVDRGDPIGLAKRIIPEVSKVPVSGLGLSKMMKTALTNAEKASTEADEALKERIQADLLVEGALLRLQAAVAQGNAVLADAGIKVTRRRRDSKAAGTASTGLTVVPTPAPTPAGNTAPAPTAPMVPEPQAA
jgi:hypothetical protein